MLGARGSKIDHSQILKSMPHQTRNVIMIALQLLTILEDMITVVDIWEGFNL